MATHEKKSMWTNVAEMKILQWAERVTMLNNNIHIHGSFKVRPMPDKLLLNRHKKVYQTSTWDVKLRELKIKNRIRLRIA